ncbi:hypothetical protein [Rhodoferax sp.]|uniref:hypothetical protein n=1 Tax=Rhodoferax sp. TaxID=50421 RepID=UPI002754F406|nr:hypothetical protein [Rhodoferax sp.]
MAQSKLWFEYCGRTVTAAFVALMAMSLTACVHAGDQRPVGMTLLFLNVGTDGIGVKRFDPDGVRGPVPGAVGAGGGGKQMSFMPGDSQRGVPQFVEVEWSIWPASLNDEMNQTLYSRADKYSPGWRRDYEAFLARVVRHTRRIDLTPIITPALIEQVRADRANTQLKLTIRFNNDQVSIEARAEKWRK